MKYTLKAYYKPREGAPHQEVALDRLADHIGTVLADRAVAVAEIRMADGTTPEVIAFYERGGRQVIINHLTNRGDIWIEAVEA